MQWGNGIIVLVFVVVGITIAGLISRHIPRRIQWKDIPWEQYLRRSRGSALSEAKIFKPSGHTTVVMPDGCQRLIDYGYCMVWHSSDPNDWEVMSNNECDQYFVKAPVPGRKRP